MTASNSKFLNREKAPTASVAKLFCLVLHAFRFSVWRPGGGCFVGLAMVMTQFSVTTISFAQAPVEVSIETTEGGAITGTLLRIDADAVVIQSAAEPLTVDIESVERVVFNEAGVGSTDSDTTTKVVSDAASGTNNGVAICQLTDGSMILAASLNGQDERFEIETFGGAKFTLNRSNVHRLLFFDPSSDAGIRQKWEEFIPSFVTPSDALIAQKNDSLQAVEGVVGDVSSDSVAFVMGDRTAVVSRSKLTGVLFYRAERALAALFCKLTLRDGSKFNIQQAVLLEGRLEVVTRSGDRLLIEPENISTMDFSSGRAVYLSDLIPTTNDWKPLIASASIVDDLTRLHVAQFNQSFNGERLTVRSDFKDGLEFLTTTSTFDKGIAIEGGGRISFTLNGQFIRLTAQVGFDPETKSLPGAVKLIVQLDGRTIVAQALENRQLASPFGLDVDVTGAQRLVIKVDYADGRSIGDRLHIVNAKVSR